MSTKLFLPDRIDWTAWAEVIDSNGITIDRPKGSVHPVHSEIVYPIDYGFVNGTMASDDEEVDIFVGRSPTGLTAAIVTEDFRKQDKEIKLIYNCDLAEIYLVNGFINFDTTLMQGKLLMRKAVRPTH